MESRMPGHCANLFSGMANAGACEALTELLVRPGLKIERIVSAGHASAPGFWYDQPHGEWVAVLQGEARLRFEDEAGPRTLGVGDFVDIAPHRRHRVEWTHPGVPTIWLAVHYGC
jgi:cupin 2 domain-containing protein